jgi:PKD repeat protein
MRRATLLMPVIVAAVAALAGCTIHQSDPPPLTGPSELGLSLGMTATPDAINRDGGSQSSILVTAHDASGQPISGLTLRLDVEAGGFAVTNSFGTLSATTIVTGADGSARAVYTAPSAPAPGTVVSTNSVTIVASPIGTNASTSVTRSAQIRLMPIGAIVPGGPIPFVDFTFAPQAPTANSPVLFDGSPSCAQPVDTNRLCAAPSSDITSFSWQFSDGGTASGRNVTHSFGLAQTYSATLTVTNSNGVSNSTTKTITVGGGIPPNGDFSFSPTAPNVGDTVQFNAEGVRAAPGHTIVQYSWNFGDPTSGASNSAAGSVATHAFSAAGTYNVVLTVRDDADQKATLTHAVVVGSGKPVAVLAISKTGGNSISGDGSGSSTTGSATITTYAFTWGDSNSDTGSAAVVAHTYGSPGTYTVRLTVTDSLGRTDTTTQSVTVP